MGDSKPFRKPSDAWLRREFEAWCEGPGSEEARRHLYELGFNDGVAVERAKAAKTKERATARAAKAAARKAASP